MTIALWRKGKVVFREPSMPKVLGLDLDDEANVIRAREQGLLELVSPARPDM